MKIDSNTPCNNKIDNSSKTKPEPIKSQSNKVSELIYYLYTPAVNTVSWCAHTIQQCFWYKEVDDLSTADLQMNAVESVKMMQYSLKYKEEIKQLRDPSSIILENLADGNNIDLHWQAMKAIINNPKSNELIDYISSNINEMDKKFALTVLEVLVGIKPGCFDWVAGFYDDEWIDGFNDDLISIMEKLTVNFPYLKMETKNSNVLFVNESPIEVFDPRRYLLLQNGHESSLMEELVSCINRNEFFQEKFSYLLGYGPTWEIFWESIWKILQEDGKDLEYPSHCCFSNEHYQQIGEVLLDNHINFDKNDPVSVGKAYHLLFPQFLTADRSNDIIDRIKNATYPYAYDGISMRTKYSTLKCKLEIRMWEHLQITW